MIKKRFLKVNILFLIMCLVFATLPFNSFAESRNQQSLSENFFVHENINGEKVYTSVIQNNETDEETKIVMTEKGQLYEVEVYVNGVFDHRVIRDTSSDKLYLLTNEGSTKTIDVKNFITSNTNYDHIYSPNVYNSLNNDMAPFELLMVKYLFDKKEFADLYGYDSISEGQETRMIFTKGTLVGVIIGAIPAIFTAGIGGILLSLGTSIIGAAIGSAVDGTVWVRTTEWYYIVGYKGWRDIML